MDIQLFRKHLHTLANLAMPIGGKLTLMRIGRLECSDEQLGLIEQKVEELNNAISAARQDLVSGGNESNALFEITYISRANEPVIENPKSALSEINDTATAYNHSNGIGGFLVYLDGYFFQRIEGPENKVRQLISNILLDPRHTDLNVISSGPKQDKNFRQWSASACRVLTGYETEVQTIRDLIKLSSEKMNSNESLALLNIVINSLWENAS